MPSCPWCGRKGELFGYCSAKCRQEAKVPSSASSRADAAENADSNAERFESAMQENAAAISVSLERAQEEHRQTTANAWQLQAASKAREAEKLYYAGLTTDSLRLANEAFAQDPSNSLAVLVAARSYNLLGDAIATTNACNRLVSLLALAPLPKNSFCLFAGELFKTGQPMLAAVVSNAALATWDREPVALCLAILHYEASLLTNQTREYQAQAGTYIAWHFENTPLKQRSSMQREVLEVIKQFEGLTRRPLSVQARAFLKEAEIAAYQKQWIPAAKDEDIAEEKRRKKFSWWAFGLLSVFTSGIGGGIYLLYYFGKRFWKRKPPEASLESAVQNELDLLKPQGRSPRPTEASAAVSIRPQPLPPVPGVVRSAKQRPTNQAAVQQVPPPAQQRRLKCPRCAQTVTVAPGGKPVCPHCGYGG